LRLANLYFCVLGFVSLYSTTNILLVFKKKICAALHTYTHLVLLVTYERTVETKAGDDEFDENRIM